MKNIIKIQEIKSISYLKKKKKNIILRLCFICFLLIWTSSSRFPSWGKQICGFGEIDKPHLNTKEDCCEYNDINDIFH